MRLGLPCVLYYGKILLELFAVIGNHSHFASIKACSLKNPKQRIGLLRAITFIGLGRCVAQMFSRKIILHEADRRATEKAGGQSSHTSHSPKRQGATRWKPFGYYSEHCRPIKRFAHGINGHSQPGCHPGRAELKCTTSMAE